MDRDHRTAAAAALGLAVGLLVLVLCARSAPGLASLAPVALALVFGGVADMRGR